ncbi:MAG: hypothetical protein QM658_17785 [Gordonia sp. (in: high G+C Gram-positive bacteria)]
MNGAAHYREAERLLDAATSTDAFCDMSDAERADMVSLAHVHATLALAAATAVSTTVAALDREDRLIEAETSGRLDEVTRIEISGWDEALGFNGGVDLDE